MDIGQKLKMIMRCAGWSQTKLAQRLAVPQKTISFWITARSLPRAKNLEEIERLSDEIVGQDEVSAKELAAVKEQAMQTFMSVEELLNNQELMTEVASQLTYHTNTIEGSTMTLEDVRAALMDSEAVIRDHSIREQMEARNHRAALVFLLREIQRPDFRWSADLIRQIHLHLMNGIMENAGELRNYRVRILGSQVPLANYETLPEKLAEFAEELNTVDGTLSGDLVAELARAHAKFEKLHPFGDGNGRTGRLIMFAQALRVGVAPPLVIKERKTAYYKYLSEAQLYEKYGLLEMLIAESILETNRVIMEGR